MNNCIYERQTSLNSNQYAEFKERSERTEYQTSLVLVNGEQMKYKDLHIASNNLYMLPYMPTLEAFLISQ